MSNYFDSMAATWDQNPMKLDRAKATAEQVKHTLFYSKKNLIDIGGGTGLLAVLLKDEFDEVVIADMSEEMLKISGKKIHDAGINNIRTLKIDEDISEIKGKYSAIVTLMTLHHVEHLEDFLSSVTDLLDEDGVLMIADLHKEDGSFHAHHNGFAGHNGFDTDELTRHLHIHGLEVIRVIDFYEIERTNESGEEEKYPLFFMAARKIFQV
ncbi:class I SAM-dependent methyltransferase [Vibrio sp. JC009]|uniref:class I SAM-dependent DNA methyltransferase n=1 Tax=Vibrio sp. JC009 TaxID=2912314 RepID=UPI0023B05804|nr:class I SAM-dependent methyltransferase [Vibrio sp. JC009]WED24261.1 class I SAM-dependent methyltransferase [Vibrio sp. JC009]